MVGELKPVPDEQRRAAEPRRHRVAVAPKGDAGVVGHDPGDLGRGRERRRREGEQRLGVGQRADGGALTVRSTAFALVTGGGAEDVEGALGLLGGRGSSWCATSGPRRSAPRTRPLPFDCRASADRARRRPRSAWPPERRTAWTSPVPGTITVARRSVRHTLAVPPRRRSTSSMASMRWAWSIFSASTPRTLPECGNVPKQHVGRRAPRGVAALEPVPLDLFAGRVVDLDGVAALDPGTGLAVRPEPGQAHLADEARVAQRIAEPLHLVIERRGPDVRVVDEPRRQVLRERLERVRAPIGPGRRGPSSR